jgi:hypothetical protein
VLEEKESEYVKEKRKEILGKDRKKGNQKQEEEEEVELTIQAPNQLHVEWIGRSMCRCK